MFLQHLKGCEDTRFLYSEFTGGVVDDYAFSCIYGHFRDRQGQYRWNLDRADAVVVDAKPLYPFAVDLLHQFVEHTRRELSGAGAFADDGHEHIRLGCAAALLAYLGAELFYFLCQFLLLILIAAGHLRKAVVAELAGNIVLIDTLKQVVQFIVAGRA